MRNIFRTDIVILGAARTPVGRFDGSLKEFSAVDLGGIAIAAAIARAGIEPSDARVVSMGSVISSGFGASPAKQAALKGGLTPWVHTRVVESVCGSSADALAITGESIIAGGPDLCIAGGMESRSGAPYLLGPRLTRNSDHYRRGERLHVKRAGAYRFAFAENAEEQLAATEIRDSTTFDGLFWPPDRKFMREHALAFAKKAGYPVSLINEMSAESHEKASRAAREGWFREEIAPCGAADSDDLMSPEEQQVAREKDPEDIASAFNSSTPADCGAAIVLASAERAAALGIRPIAYLRGYARVDGPPEEYLAAPVAAARELQEGLSAAGRPSHWEIVEANESFGIQLPLFAESFPDALINPHGGAVALGHPLGAAGARLVTTMLYSLKRYRKKIGLVTTCFGGGGGYALAIESIW
ncbi:MAG TPA: thiolase family protein [Armatimonadota bacterium]|nr:thiolase family protein [Armatimonadota bacterium]